MQDRELYNKDAKLKFLSQYDEEGTINSYEYVLSKAFKKENEYDKDLYDFNDIEIDSLLGSLEAKSFSSIMYQKSIFSKYVTFAIEEGWRSTKSKINFFDLPRFSVENLKEYTIKAWSTQRIMTREDIYKTIVEECENAQDGVIYALTFEGAMGEALEELVNLTINDVDKKNNKLTLRKNDGSARTIKVSGECIDVILRAYDEKEYKRILIKSEENVLNSKPFKLVKSEYILRFTERKDATKQINHQVIRQRFAKIRKYYNNEHLTFGSIRLSGMIDMAQRFAKELRIENLKDLPMEYYKRINVQFGVGTGEQGDYTHSATKQKILKAST